MFQSNKFSYNKKENLNLSKFKLTFLFFEQCNLPLRQLRLAGGATGPAPSQPVGGLAHTRLKCFGAKPGFCVFVYVGR
jgi:hypothetical protein